MMKTIGELTAQDIAAMDYNQLIGLTRETNRTPGGAATIKEVCRLLLLHPGSRVLDIGTSTGHSAIEFSRLAGCFVDGIDINDMSLAVARERCKQLKLDKAKFHKMDAAAMDFPDGAFDVVYAGNVTSLVSDRSKVLREYWRVLAPNGYLVAAPMYYLTPPPQALLDDVRAAIQVHITAYYKEDWKKFFLTEGAELYEERDFRFLKCSDQEIDAFCENILSREHLRQLPGQAMALLRRRYAEYMHLFNENLSRMGHSILILRRRECDVYNDPQLFFSAPR